MSMPPLPERNERILPLARHFVRKHWQGPDPPSLSDECIRALLTFEWQGSRLEVELESAIVRAIQAAPNGTIRAAHLGLHGSADSPDGDPGSADGSYKAQKRRAIEQFERTYLTNLMLRHRGNVTRAARAAGKERRDLGKTLKRLGIDPRAFRSGPTA